MNDSGIDVDKAHRWFAVECNNQAWDLLDKTGRSAEEMELAVAAAHAAYYHWRAAGGPVQQVRALQLLGVVYAEAERPVESLRYARQALELARTHLAELADWDLPFVYEACARAHAAAGERAEAREFRALAAQAGREIADPESRQVVANSLDARNWFGIDDLVTLADPAGGATARIHAGFGFNCFELRLPSPSGLCDVLWSAPGFETGAQRPSGSGVPLLFPFPGRIAGGRFTWDGRDYEIPPTDNRGNAIHGFVLNRPWRVVERSPTRVVGEFQGSIDAPDLADRWPADYAIRADYELSGSRFVMRYEFWNPDDRPLPCGFGSHPYFRLPLGGDSAGACQVSLPVTDEWELVELLPTGVRRPAADAEKLQAGRPFSALQLDNVFAGMLRKNGVASAVIRDPGSGRSLSIRWDETFRECVVYTPPHREAICIEPYTCAPGAVQLEPRGLDAGLRVLAPGDRVIGEVVFELV